jgi:hypothetical protein
MMDVAVELLHRLPAAAVRLLANPFYYAGIVLVVLQYRRQIKLERKLFSTRLHSLIGETWRAALWGAVGGLGVSIVMAFLGAAIRPETLWLLWGAALILMMFRIRFLCLAYSAGAIGMLAAIVSFVPEAAQPDALGSFFRAVRQVDVPTLLAITGVLHVLEGILVRTQGARMAMPMFYEGKRGKIIGGFQLQGFWPIPLLLIAPLGGGSDASLPWPTVLGGSGQGAGWTVLSLPFLIGFAELTLSGSPSDKAKSSSIRLALYGVIVVLLALGVHYWKPLSFLASLICIVLHEMLIGYSRWIETKRAPLYVHNDRGLRVLAVLPGSAAAELGIVPGEIVHKVNGQQVRNRDELHQALRLNSAFSKLEVINLQGEIKFVSRPLYANEHHQLGLILAPDDEALYYVETRQPGILGYVGRRLAGLARNPALPGRVQDNNKDLS